MGQDAKCLLRVMAVQKLRDLPAGGAENHELFDFILENGFVQVIDTGLTQDRIDQARRTGFLKLRVSLTASLTAAETGTCI